MVTGFFSDAIYMGNFCGLCNETSPREVYSPERSTRGIKVHLCRHCGLVQSLPRIDRAPRRGAAVSSGADWGNVRYGKGFRTKIMLETIARHADLSAHFSLLDVGSNRGSFARALLSAAPRAQLAALEPDERVLDSCAGLERTELVHARIEAARFEDGRFDIVHSCHTLEHLADPASVLADHWRVLKPGGILAIDVPNIAFLGADDVVEEWFIDKHLYHFSARTLLRMIQKAGFEIIQEPDPADRDNLLVVARKRSVPQAVSLQDPEEAEHAEALIATYVATRARNLMALTTVAAEIMSMKRRGIAMWGAGRIFDSLVVHGHFDTRALTILIDKNLGAHVPERYGCVLHEPDALRKTKAEVVIIMSRSFAAEIADEARRLLPRADIFFYSDLLAQARRKIA